MLTPDKLHDYQKKAVVHQCSMPNTMLWLDMGLGKTVVTLTSIAHLLSTRHLRAVVIVAPIRVCRLVWRKEAAGWEHTKHLKFEMLTGTKDSRTRALLRPADVYLINYENLGWLATTLKTYFIDEGKPPPFDGIVWDEISKCKNSTTRRVEAYLKIAKHFKWTTGLTGTPASNGYKDLHGQYLVVDGGQRLGVSKTKFETYYYHKDGPYKKAPYAHAEEELKGKIADITLEMSAEDYNPLPDLIVNDIEADLPDDLRQKYESFEREMFMQLDQHMVEVFNQAALMNKCLQFSQGAVYPIAGITELWEPIHDLKLDILEDIIEEAQGNPILCSYAFKVDAERIIKRFGKDLDVINLTECKSESALNNAMNRWVKGELPLMIGHPQSMGHGIDGLQKRGRHLAHFGLTWSLDLYLQFNARIRRQGQGASVMCHRIMITNTLDQAQALALDGKATTQAGLRKAVKDYRLLKGV